MAAISLAADFADKDYSDLFHHAVKCIIEYEKFQYADKIETGIDIRPALNVIMTRMSDW